MPVPLTRSHVRVVWPWRAALCALVATVGLWAALERLAASARPRVGLVFHDDACELWPGMAQQAGGALTPGECRVIAQIVRSEVEEAFAGLRLDVTTRYRLEPNGTGTELHALVETHLHGLTGKLLGRCQPELVRVEVPGPPEIARRDVGQDLALVQHGCS